MEAPRKDCCHSDCDKLTQERMHYFTGRHLAARDFSDEQSYHRSHRYLHNRMLHGWGVVCGLEVLQHDQADCRTKYVRVGSGLAIDCCGREIVVECPACCGDEQPEIPWDEYQESHPWLLLCLSYHECGIEPVPVLHSEGDCSTNKTDTKHGRYKEGWKLNWHWVAKSDLKKYSWDPAHCHCPPKDDDKNDTEQTPEQQDEVKDQKRLGRLRSKWESPVQETPPPEPSEPRGHKPPVHPHVHPSDCPHDDCAEPCTEGYRSCLEPHCPPGHCVPLALICARKGEPITSNQILMRGRPQLPYGPQRLTHVVGINWPHGGVITPRWLESNNTLVVTFDRKLLATQPRYYPGPWGVNQASFMVQFGQQEEDLDFVLYEEPPSLTDGGLSAEYRIALRKGKHEGYDYLEGHTLWITLKGDFLYDCHGVKVDGNNNGVAGGTFESWVTVIDNEEYDRLEKEGLL